MARWKTRITGEYGIELPFIGAGMAFVASAELVAAVSNAGGLGVFGSGVVDPATLGETIDGIRKLTDKPFGVDFIPRFTLPGHIQTCVEKRVPVVVFFYDLPNPEWVRALHDVGTRVWMQVGSIQETRDAVALGVDALIAQGSEAGGHNKSKAATFSLVPAVIAHGGGRPVIAAGGIATGEGVAAALALGAEAVWVGTRLVATQEADAADEYKQRVLAATAEDTVHTTLFGPEFPGGETRVLRNQVVNEWAGREAQLPPPSVPPTYIGTTQLPTPNGGRATLSMPRFSVLLPTRGASGDFEQMCLLAGESAGLVEDVPPAGEVVRRMMEDARRIITSRLVSLAPGEGGS